MRHRIDDFVDVARPYFQTNMSTHFIAEKLGLPVSSVHRLRKRMGFKTPPRGVRIDQPRAQKSGSKIANMPMKCGVKEHAGALFFDRFGNAVPNTEVMREVEIGYQYFLSKRGGQAARKGLEK